jgi:uncharacterized membrane protein
VKRLKKESKETERVEAFSDAVFSVAITLLILEFKVPDMPDAAGNSNLFRALLGLWPSFLALIISFLTILTCGSIIMASSSCWMTSIRGCYSPTVFYS